MCKMPHFPLSFFSKLTWWGMIPINAMWLNLAASLWRPHRLIAPSGGSSYAKGENSSSSGIYLCTFCRKGIYFRFLLKKKKTIIYHALGNQVTKLVRSIYKIELRTFVCAFGEICFGCLVFIYLFTWPILFISPPTFSHLAHTHLRQLPVCSLYLCAWF